MKYSQFYIKIFYIILVLLLGLGLVRFLYYLYTNHNKNMLVNEILNQWTKQTNGSYNKQTRGVHTDDYFLYFSKDKDYKTHIHLVTNNFYSNFYDFLSIFFNPRFEIIPTTQLGYIIKKNNEYLPPVKINQTKESYDICKDMIEMYKNINMC